MKPYYLDFSSIYKKCISPISPFLLNTKCMKQNGAIYNLISIQFFSLSFFRLFCYQKIEKIAIDIMHSKDTTVYRAKCPKSRAKQKKLLSFFRFYTVKSKYISIDRCTTSIQCKNTTGMKKQKINKKWNFSLISTIFHK